MICIRSNNIQISNFLLIRVLHLDDNDVKTNYRRIFSTVFGVNAIFN